MRMQGKGVIVTGGASGIGAAAVRRMVEEGARVVVADMNEELGAALVRELGDDKVRFLRTDVTDQQQVEALFKEAAAFGGVDAVFNNAGIGHQAAAVDVTDEEWGQVIGINLTGVFRVAREAMRYMQGRGGSIINCASILGHFGQSSTAPYTAAKGGVVNLTRTLALEGAPEGIRVNSISPGYIDTPLLELLDQELKDFLISLHPVGRLGRSEEVANAALFLASDEASFITGADLPVDGGFLAGKS